MFIFLFTLYVLKIYCYKFLRYKGLYLHLHTFFIPLFPPQHLYPIPPIFFLFPLFCVPLFRKRKEKDIIRNTQPISKKTVL